MQQFTLPGKIIMGADIFSSNTNLFSSYGKKAFIVTGPHIVKSPMMKQLLDALTRECIAYEIYSGITSEPTDTMIGNGVKAYVAAACDFCIGIGGGSPLDSAKAIAAMTVNDGEIADYNGKTIATPTPPVVAIPTTAGTGSEATKFTIVTDSAKGIKMLLKGDVLLPALAIVDYTFSATSPRSVTVATGLDALTHAIESFISVKAMPLTDTYALSATARIMKWLPQALKDGDNPEARRQMAIAALEAGICINNSSVTVVHGMSRPIGALFHVPHGISNAMLLAVCLEDMENAAKHKFTALAKAVGLQSSAQFIKAVKDLCDFCEVPTLQGYGIDESRFLSSISKMATDAIASGSPANAPKSYTAHDCEQLYVKAFH